MGQSPKQDDFGVTPSNYYPRELLNSYAAGTARKIKRPESRGSPNGNSETPMQSSSARHPRPQSRSLIAPSESNDSIRGNGGGGGSVWVQSYSKQHQRNFWRHKITKEVVWTKPKPSKAELEDWYNLMT